MIKTFQKQLKTFNRIAFEEKSHSYFIDKQPASKLSVTKAIKRFKKEFDVESNAQRMSRKTNATVEQIKEEWERNRNYSATFGTLVHKYIDCHYKQQEFIAEEGLLDELTFDEKARLKETLFSVLDQFHSFDKQNSFLTSVANELVVGDLDDTKICGTLDMLVYNKHTNKLEILDFKTNKKMQKHTPFGFLYYPFERFTEGELNEYAIQLNTYQYFIEKYTNLKIEGLKIVWLNANNPSYQIFKLENLQPEIKLMLDKIKADSLFLQEN